MTFAAAHPGVFTLAGTPKEVEARLGKSRADRVLVVAFDHVRPKVFETVAKNLSDLAVVMFEVLQERQERDSLEQLVAALVPRTPPPAYVLKEASMLVRARKAVLADDNWLTAAEVADLAGLSTRNPSAQPNKWKKQGAIFAINHNGIDYFPLYGLDAEAGFRPLKSLARVIDVFAGRKDGWSIAYWFLSDNGYLGGRKPKDLLASDPERVIEAAKDDMQEIAHG